MIDPVHGKACPVDDSDFANFLSRIFKSEPITRYMSDRSILERTIDFSKDEFIKALKQLSNLRRADRDGVVAEMLKYGSDRLHGEILYYFNLVTRYGQFPASWHLSIFHMLPKDGDLREAFNWRPIAPLPILYKLYSRMLYNRFSSTLFSHQSMDQHAFTPGLRLEDALLSAEVAIEYSNEWTLPL